ncbi:MAG TPA: BamA/TamA family outer membrane protein [Edaphocola sp.]|nr:BamA/TamA family outer membrane protein [Edaphocola sp.]
MIKYIACLFCILWNANINILIAQEKEKTVKIIYQSPNETIIDSKNKSDSATMLLALNKRIANFRNEGFLAASIDSIKNTADTFIAYIYKGEKFSFGTIKTEGIPTDLLNQTGIGRWQLEGKVLSVKKINSLIEKILTFSENNGYPFASLKFKNIEWDGERKFNALIDYQQGPLTRIDTIEIRGSSNVDYRYILSYLGLKNHQLYNEEVIAKISKKIKELPFIEEEKPWEMSFSILRTKLILYLKDKASNQVNALLGFQPTNEETKKFLWTADIQLLLNNTLGYGETFSASYKNLQHKSPEFNIKMITPYILGTPFALDADFEYYSRDTLYNKTSFEGGLRYLLSERDFLRVAYHLQSNRVPSPNLVFVQTNKRLNNNADIRSDGLSVNFQMDRTDFSKNPHKGWKAFIGAEGLNRIIKKNSAILALNDGFDYEKLYDTINLHPLQYKLEARLDYFVPITRQISIWLGYQGAYNSGNNLFQNELFQIGGIKTLRGFDEKSIYANQYHIGTIALKTILSQGSYFQIFSDFGQVFTHYNQMKYSNRPLSLGMGLTLENKTGIFNFIIAMGKHQNESFQFRNTNVHFGYISYF